MKKLLPYILILLAGLGIWYAYTTISRLKKENAEYQNNLTSHIQNAQELSAEITVSKDQYKELFTRYAKVSDSLIKEKRKVKVVSHQVIKYERHIDTVLKPVFTEKQDNFGFVATYEKDCLNAVIVFNSEKEVVDFQLNEADVEFHIIPYLVREKNWFWKLHWGRKGWEAKTTVNTPCGYELVGNTIYKIK